MGWEVMLYSFLTMVAVITVFNNEARIKRIEHNTYRTKLYLKLIMERLEIEVPSRLSERIQAIALDPRNKIEAMKLYRQETGASLLEAKDVIEDFIEENRHLTQ
ncbi:hypothetical protein LC593_10175 [Nostoc sp. CHAB 5844]|nr:hypothetical protein [Nostoc sp. CHAB 5844]